MKLLKPAIIIWALLFTASVSLADDGWGSWDDLPNNIFDDKGFSNNSLDNIEALYSSEGSLLPEDLEAWLLELDDRLMLDAEEFQHLLEDLEGEDPDEILEELEEWLEDQEDDEADEADELEDAAKKEDD